MSRRSKRGAGRALALGLAAFAGAAGGVIAGAIAEHTRPFGTEWHRRCSVDLARRIAAMDRAKCCHD